MTVDIEHPADGENLACLVPAVPDQVSGDYLLGIIKEQGKPVDPEIRGPRNLLKVLLLHNPLFLTGYWTLIHLIFRKDGSAYLRAGTFDMEDLSLIPQNFEESN